MGSLLVVFLCLMITVAPAYATGVTAANPEKITELEQRAETAQPQDQCYLYALVISDMAILADQQMSSGDAEHAQKTLEKMETYTARLHKSLGPKNKKLKESEILVRQTARRVEGMFHQAEIEQQDMLRSSLHHLNALQAELMLNVFQH